MKVNITAHNAYNVANLLYQASPLTIQWEMVDVPAGISPRKVRKVVLPSKSLAASYPLFLCRKVDEGKHSNLKLM